MYPQIQYVGYSLDVDARIATHNAGRSAYTAKYKPWELVMFLGFKDQLKAKEFEQYLKSQSGRAFMQKRLL